MKIRKKISVKKTRKCSNKKPWTFSTDLGFLLGNSNTYSSMGLTHWRVLLERASIGV